MTPRIKAFLIHLGISLLILVALLYILIFIWYPPPFFASDGGWQGIKIIVGVDLVLGPLMTLAVFDIKKSRMSLVRDLTIIGLIQIVALAGGTWVVADQRTRLVMFVNDHFISMTKALIDESGASQETLDSLKTSRPAMGYIELPSYPGKRRAMVLASTQGAPLYKRGDLYRPLTQEALIDIASHGFDLGDTIEARPELKDRVEKFLSGNKKESHEVSAIPVYCRYGNPSLIIDRATGDIIDTIEISHDQLLSSLIIKKRKEMQESQQ